MSRPQGFPQLTAEERVARQRAYFYRRLAGAETVRETRHWMHWIRRIDCRTEPYPQPLMVAIAAAAEPLSKYSK